MFKNIDAEAQFSYTHSDGTVISCKKAPIQMEEYKGSIEAKYVEVINKKIMIYGTSANVSNPKTFTRVDVEAISLAHIAFDQEHLAVMVGEPKDDTPMTVMFVYTSPQTNQIYLHENGVKSKETPSPTTVANIEFPSHTLAKAFVYEVIANLPTEKQKEAEKVFEDIYYGMAGEMKRQQDMQARKKNEITSYKPIYFKRGDEIMFSIYYDESTASSLNTKVYRGDKAKLLFTTYKDIYKGEMSKTAKFENCSYCSIHSITDVGTRVITIKDKPNAIKYQMMFKDNDWYLIKGTGTNTEVDYNSNFDKLEICNTSNDGDIYGKCGLSIESEAKLNAKTKLWVMAMLHMAGYIGDDGSFGE